MGNENLKGSMEVLNSFQITEGMEGLDLASKELYRNKEVLAIILKGVPGNLKTAATPKSWGLSRQTP